MELVSERMEGREWGNPLICWCEHTIKISLSEGVSDYRNYRGYRGDLEICRLKLSSALKNESLSAPGGDTFVTSVPIAYR